MFLFCTAAVYDTAMFVFLSYSRSMRYCSIFVCFILRQYAIRHVGLCTFSSVRILSLRQASVLTVTNLPAK